MDEQQEKQGIFCFFKNNVWFIILIIGLITSIQINRSAIADNKQDQESIEKIGLIGEALDIIQNDFVDTGYETTKLIYGAIEGMLNVLDDPHTRFMDPQESNEMVVETEGKFGGLGIVIGIQDDQLTVISPIEGTPAFKAGLEPDDHIIKIEGKLTDGIKLQDAVNSLRGKPNTNVTITVSRENVPEPFDVTLTRAIINIRSAKYTIIPPDIFYIRLASFSQNSAPEIDEALNYAKKNKEVSKIILDLRNNPGGLLSAAVSVSEKFLEPGQVIVSTRGRKEDQNAVYKAESGPGPDYIFYPMVVLVNGASASASEIVAGAMQDHKRAVIVGKKTYGKASVQTVKSMSDNSTIAITTAKYYTPNNRLIHKKGIDPDMEVENIRPEESDIKSIRELYKKTTLHDFAKDHENFMTDANSDTIFKEFYKKIQSEGINISENLLRRYVISELTKRFDGQVYYDLKSDNQLREAVNVLRAAHILNSAR